MNKKIAVLTWLNNGNYGSLLQAYALQKFLLNNKYLVKHIDYKPSIKYKLLNWVKSKNSPKLFIGKIQIFFIKIFNKEYIDLFSSKNKKNDLFKEKYIQKTEQINNPNFLNFLEKEYDLFICGSDQIWSPKLFNPTFFLDFIKDKPKIAYAPSFGVNSIKKSASKKMSYLLKQFSNISVREANGQKFIYQMLGEKVPITLDPTFLLTKKEWEDLCINRIEKDYILCFLLTPNEAYVDKIKKYASENKKKVVIIPTILGPFKTGFLEKVAIDPIEWITYIKNADMIFTDSFHACIFSIIFNKKFIVFKRFKENKNWSENSRIYNLAHTFKFEKNVFGEDDEILYSELHYEDINSIIEKNREFSKNWLLNAIEGTNYEKCK